MILIRMIMAITVGVLGLLEAGNQASARPSHRHFRHIAKAAAVETTGSPADWSSDRAAFGAGPFGTETETVRPSRRARNAASPENVAATSIGIGGGDLVTRARQYIGTNPTGRNSLWCGAFMDMVLKQTGHAGGGNLASAYARYGTPVAGPQVGAIAVMGRRGGGHVGVVSGIDASGNPIVISGNHNRRVAESVYPRGRIRAYVLPN